MEQLTNKGKRDTITALLISAGDGDRPQKWAVCFFAQKSLKKPFPCM
jgi:hypothetical protein